MTAPIISRKIVPCEYEGLEIDFSTNDWFNATQAAKRFGKRLQDWLDNADTQTYLKAVAAHLNHADWRDLKKARRGKYGLLPEIASRVPQDMTAHDRFF